MSNPSLVAMLCNLERICQHCSKQIHDTKQTKLSVSNTLSDLTLLSITQRMKNIKLLVTSCFYSVLKMEAAGSSETFLST